LFPNAVRDTGAKTRAWLRFDHWGAAKVRAPTWRDRNGPLSSVPDLAGSANRRVDHFHLDQFTADCVPVQRSGTVSAI